MGREFYSYFSLAAGVPGQTTAIVTDILAMGLPDSVMSTPTYLLLLFGSNAAMGIMIVYSVFIWDPVKSLRRKMERSKD